MTSRRPSKRHQWREGEQPPALDNHGAAKHRILSDYIQEYLRVVCANLRVKKFDITLVDGFAGGGIYQDNKPGSPLVMIGAVNRAIVDINQDRKDRVAINPRYFFIEADSDNFNYLQETLSGNSHAERILPLNGDFVSYVDDIIDAVKKRNPRGGGGVIFFLDQEGFSAVNMKILRKIRENLPQSEIILTFSISWLIDFIMNSEQLTRQVGSLGIEYLNVDEIIRMKKDIKDLRNAIESKFSIAIQKSAAFPYFVPFFIEPEGNHRGYWLLHLSPHYRAHNVMIETIWKYGNSVRHYGGAGARLHDIFYEGGLAKAPSLFGDIFAEAARNEHKECLIMDLPKIIWGSDAMSVEELIKSTCNITAASPEMYTQALSTLWDEDEIVVSGKSGGKKRVKKISLSDRVEPQRQIILF